MSPVSLDQVPFLEDCDTWEDGIMAADSSIYGDMAADHKLYGA